MGLVFYQYRRPHCSNYQRSAEDELRPHIPTSPETRHFRNLLVHRYLAKGITRRLEVSGKFGARQ
jgi:hypothetical protein